jgi:curved DNA-binding protein
MAVEFKDYYQVLGVPRHAGDDEIKKAFRKLARQYHPDVAKDKKAAEEKFKEINEAYEVLGNPANRKKYDELGAHWKQGAGFRPPPGWHQQAARGGGRGPAGAEEFEFHFGGTGFSDFFEQFFGRGRGGGFGGFGGGHPGDGEVGHAESEEGAFAMRGSDVESDLLVTLDEVLRGSVRSVSVRRVHPQTGQAGTHTFKVRIPAGVKDGQLIRLAGKGEAGIGGGEAGDLYLRVRFARHPDFEVRDANLEYTLPIAPWEAVLGATVSVPTLEGSVMVKVPPGSNNGQRLRVRGRGLPRKGGERGDLFITLEVQLPARISAREKALWTQLAEGSEFKPRAG